MKKIFSSLALFISLLVISYADRPISESDNWQAIGIKDGLPLWSGIIPRGSEYKKHPNQRPKRQAEEEEGSSGTNPDEDETLEGEGEQESGAEPANPEAQAGPGPQRPGNTKYKIRTRPKPSQYQNTGIDQGLAAEVGEESFSSSSGNKKPAKTPATNANAKQTGSQSQSQSSSKDTAASTTQKPLNLEDIYEEQEGVTEPKEEAESTTTEPPSLIPVIAGIIKSVVGGGDNTTKPLNVTHTLNYASNFLLSPFGLEFNFLSPGSKNKNKPPTKPAKEPSTKPKQKPATAKPKPTPPPQVELHLIPVKSPPPPIPQILPGIPGVIIDQAPVGPIKGGNGLEKPFSPDAPFILYKRTVPPETTTPFQKFVAPFREFPFISPTVHPGPSRQSTQRTRNTTPYVKLVGAFSGRAIDTNNVEVGKSD